MELFVHITGSTPRTDGPKIVVLVERTAYETARALLREKVGVVALVGASSNDATAHFDDAIVKAAADHVQDTGEAGIVIRTVRHQTVWMERISDETREYLDRLDGHISGESISDDEYTGNSIRQAQARLSDGAVTIGGYRGVHETARRLLTPCHEKPVDEIFVKGLSGGLPNDIRAQVDELRGWRSEADRRTVHHEPDCTRIAHWVARDMADRLRKAGNADCMAAAVSPQSGKQTIGNRRKAWNALSNNQVASWVGNFISAIRLWPASNGGS